MAAAEAFLPTYLAAHNQRLAQRPAGPIAAWRRAPPDLADRLACRYTRVVARDDTVRLGTRLVQIPRGTHGQSYAGWRVELRECLDGRLLVEAHGRRLGTAPAPPGVEFVLVPRHAARPRTVSRTRAMAPRPMSSLKALTALAQHLRQTARPHPWRQIFSRRQRTRQRHDTATR